VDTKVVREILSKLLTARLVERCPAPEPVVSTSFKETTTRKRGAKAAKVNNCSLRSISLGSWVIFG